MRVRKSTVRFILFVYFILLFSFAAYLGDLGDWKQFKYSETVHTITTVLTMPEKCMGCLYGERKTKESDFIPETRQKKPSRHSGIIAKISISGRTGGRRTL